MSYGDGEKDRTIMADGMIESQVRQRGRSIRGPATRHEVQRAEDLSAAFQTALRGGAQAVMSTHAHSSG